MCTHFPLQSEFLQAALNLDGSGFIWLVTDDNVDIHIITTSNYRHPVQVKEMTLHPVLCLDLWEHAYYHDCRSDREQYVKEWWKYVNWPFASAEFIKSVGAAYQHQIKIHEEE